ncbi:VOC family protein [Ruegeria sp. 2205SS24-7]|uniref:VOC family protein n=1 Tax=Ruegeria discodermiae TaxID=3064389 RepID=UPI0027419B8C|nr:VOC family protein [Ruegeria sp. 2205SS24-7]MDP5216588.1 VOC family protein [Ruegeria sp. 2205SS24-7]
MPRIRGINHVTLVCSGLDRSCTYYCDILGAQPRARWATGAYLELGALWLCLELGTPDSRADDTHLALDCDASDYNALAARITAASAQWKENGSEVASLYFLDPDGHKLELHVGDLCTRLVAYQGRDDVEIFPPPVSGAETAS